MKLDQERLAQAVAEEKKRKAKGDKDDVDRSSKKQKSSLEGGSHEVTEEELGMYLPFFLYLLQLKVIFSEAYRMSRRMTEDPMANYVDEDL